VQKLLSKDIDSEALSFLLARADFLLKLQGWFALADGGVESSLEVEAAWVRRPANSTPKVEGNNSRFIFFQI
jgi:hypothetical protein